MLFWLKKALTIPFLPLYFAMLAGGIGVLVGWSGRGLKLARTLVALSFATLAIFSNDAVSRALMRPLENRYPPIPEIRKDSDIPPELRACRALVILGGGHADAPSLSRVNQLSESTLSRVAEASRLLRWLPGAMLVTSGHHTAEISHAQVVEEALISLGVSAERIRRMDDPWDTDDEIAEVKRDWGDARVAIVTSAWHMPRAMALCEKYHVNALPCPADYTDKPEPASSAAWVRWDIESLERSTKAIHEDLGRLWLTIKG